MTANPYPIEHDAADDPFQLLLQVSHEGICLVDAAGLCRAISSTGAQLLGYLPQELRGRGFHDLVHSSPGAGADCSLCGPTKEDFQGVELFVRKDGKALKVQATARPLFVGPGLQGRFVVFTPVLAPEEVGEEPEPNTGTEATLRRALAELAAERQQTESVHAFGRRLFVTPFGDLDRALVDQFCDLTDSKLGLLYKIEEPEGDLVLAGSRGLFGSGVADRIAPGQGTLRSALSARYPLVEDHAASPVELAGRTLRHIMYVPLADDEEDLGVLILARTVTRPYSATEQKSVAQLADLASVALGNSRLVARLERLSQLSRAALDGIVEAIRVVGSDGRDLLTNASMEHLSEELELGRSLYGPEAREFADRTTDPEAYLTELSEMQADLERRSHTEWELADSGRVFERYTSPIHDSLGTLIGRVLVLREVTLERSAERLQSELISVVSHELRTPLTSMLGFTNVLLEEGTNEGEWSIHVETIRGEITRLLSIVDDLLDFQRVGEGKFSLDRTVFDVRDLISQQAAAFAKTSPIHEVISDLGSDPLVVDADRYRIAQVLANLLSNAIKYSPKGGPVRVSAEREADRIRVFVSDTGIGIPDDQRDKVFTKFFRVESSETTQVRGLGLGLALSREIVAAHGGSIGFESAPGAGALFWFELPAV